MAEDGTEQRRTGAAETSRVVLRGGLALMLDGDMNGETRKAIIDLAAQIGCEPVPTWTPVAMQSGQPDAAVRAFAGDSGSPDCLPGSYRALANWFGPVVVIEPPVGGAR